MASKRNTTSVFSEIRAKEITEERRWCVSSVWTNMVIITSRKRAFLCFCNVYWHSSNLNESPWKHFWRWNQVYIQPVCQYLQYGIETPRPPKEVEQIHHLSLYLPKNPLNFYTHSFKSMFIVISYTADKRFELVDTVTRGWRGIKHEV